MKSIEEILDNYSEYETFLEDRFGRRLCDFLTAEQAEKIGWRFKDEYKDKHIPKEWTEENIIKQLHEDVDFGWEKCRNERGISSELMAEVVRSWCRVLENGLQDVYYGWYGDNVFKTVAERYGFELV